MSNLSSRELELAARLDRLSLSYAPAADQTDPIRSPAFYERPEDREVAAWIGSAFAYGRVETILGSVDRILKMVPALHEARPSNLDEPAEVHGIETTEALADLAWRRR